MCALMREGREGGRWMKKEDKRRRRRYRKGSGEGRRGKTGGRRRNWC